MVPKEVLIVSWLLLTLDFIDTIYIAIHLGTNETKDHHLAE